MRAPIVKISLCCLTFAAVCAAQTQTDVPELGEAVIRTTTTNVVAPTLVTDRAGNIVDGLQPAQFHLFDNGKEQNIQVDVTFQPISLVVAVEVSSRVEGLFPQLKRLGSLLPVVLGAHGEAALIAFDSRLRLMQDFTTDADKMKNAIDHLVPGNSNSRMIDAVDMAVRKLRSKPPNTRRVILLVSEARDISSEGRLREAIIDAQISNVMIYTVDINQIAVRLNERPMPPRPDPIDRTSVPPVMGQPATPTTTTQNGVQSQIQFVPLLKEIYDQAKRIFVDNPTETITKATGGSEFSFVRQRGLEEAIQKISTELRSQYLISYNPSNKEEPGFHEISVVIERSNYIAKTRPGYWLAGGKQ